MSKTLCFELLEPFLSAQTQNDNFQQSRKIKKILPLVIQNQLTQRQREILLLYFFHQKKQTEIGFILGIDKSSVSRTLKRAIQNLKKFIQYYPL